MNNCMEYFLGGNTGMGFRSLFGQAYSPSDGWRVSVIKGGPGTGKSTAMKRIADKAEQLGLYHEVCRCSSDPKSIDAVIIPDIKRAVFDGTAPHVLEPALVGCCENIINFGSAWDNNALYTQRDEIAEQSEKCACFHKTARCFLLAADAFRENTFMRAAACMNIDKIEKCAQRLAGCYLPHKSGGNGRTAVRQLSAVTPDGVQMLRYADGTCGDTVIRIDDRTGAPSSLLLDLLCAFAVERGIDVAKCICSQSGRTEHLIMRDLSLAFTVSNDIHPVGAGARTIHCERFFTGAELKQCRSCTAVNRKGVKEYTALASEQMKKARAAHDLLERYYIAAVDFGAIDALTEQLASEVFS